MHSITLKLFNNKDSLSYPTISGWDAFAIAFSRSRWSAAALLFIGTKNRSLIVICIRTNFTLN